MSAKRVAVDHPLWETLLALDKVAAKRFPSKFDPGFGSLGLILHARLKRYEYWCDPVNCLTFATTGGEGVHFSFVVQDGKVTENSPVVITIPGTFEHPNFIGGESLFDFLCLGFHRGYFAMETLASERFFEAYASGKWPLSEVKDRHPDWDRSEGYWVDERKRKLLDFLIDELGLTPWKDLKTKFQRLQNRYMPLLEISDDGDDLC